MNRASGSAHFASATLIDAIQNGTHQSMAVSLVFFGDGGSSVGVPWMQISDTASAGAFADALRNTSRPAMGFTAPVAAGISFATDQFGTETGGAPNGFESARQSISVNTETFVVWGSTPQEVSDARQQSLNSGVDVISGITVGNFAVAESTAFYNANIVGGSSAGQPGEVVNVDDYANFPAGATDALNRQILSIVPEPGTTSLIVLGAMGVFLRRRRPSFPATG